MLILIGALNDLLRWEGNVQSSQKVILKGDGSVDNLFSRLWKIFKVFGTPKESGFLMEPI